MKLLKTKKYSILSTISKFSFLFVLAFSLFISVNMISAQGGAGTGNSGAETGGVNIVNKIKNPLHEKLDTLPAFIHEIIKIVLYVGVPIVTLAIIYSGFLFVQARGKPEALKKAKGTLMYTLIGAAILLGAFVIAEAIQSTVEEIKSSN